MTPVSEPLSALSPGYQPLYRNVYIFTAVPGQCLSQSQADPQLVTPDPVTPGRWSGRGGGCDPVTIIRELMAISGERGGADFQL